MPLELPEIEVVTIAPREEIVASYAWITSLLISAPSALADGSIVMRRVPWIGPGHEVTTFDDSGTDLTKVIRLDNLFAAMQVIPELQTAFDAIIAAVPAVEAYLAAQE